MAGPPAPASSSSSDRRHATRPQHFPALPRSRGRVFFWLFSQARKARGYDVGASGGGALQAPCPPASACGRHLLLYLRLKGTPARRLKVRGGQSERRRGLMAFPKPSPVVAGRPLRVSKGGGRSRRRRPGDMERKGLPAAAGPVRSRRGKAKRQTRSQVMLCCYPSSELAGEGLLEQGLAEGGDVGELY